MRNGEATESRKLHIGICKRNSAFTAFQSDYLGTETLFSYSRSDPFDIATTVRRCSWRKSPVTKGDELRILGGGQVIANLEETSTGDGGNIDITARSILIDGGRLQLAEIGSESTEIQDETTAAPRDRFFPSGIQTQLNSGSSGDGGNIRLEIVNKLLGSVADLDMD